MCIFWSSCFNKRTVVVYSKEYKEDVPPSTVQVDENLFVDVYEVTNISYREYTAWLSLVFGEESEEFQQAQPDKTVMEREIRFGEPYVTQGQYFNHPAYNDYPVVGITLEQAKGFTKWRTDRVIEDQLIRAKLIERIIPTRESYFTLDKYLTGEFKAIISQEIILAPYYYIPSETGWEFIAQGNVENQFGIDSLALKKWQRKNRSKEVFNVGKAEFDQDHYSMIYPTNFLAKSTNGLHHIFGNVAELVDDPLPISKGGSWKHSLEESAISKTQIFEGPNSYTGFRNVCFYEFFEPY